MKDTITAKVPEEYITTEEFEDWKKGLQGRDLDKIDATLEAIEDQGIIQSSKALGNGLYEKKWRSGLRIYFAVVIENGKQTLVILGSGKGKKQEKAIKKSLEILEDKEVYKGDISYK